jgi:hypothetical protein|uniref:Uncharacterized protein n=1 Tax=Eutreptiella gymnastica TaxID=73025 RepID=A0A7S4GBP4_9EUGL|mmetsp:Transcript_83493/g.139360  ORF Transcript_83493/g.139360 Transcript_83493/m.139360 type:complete len:105 (-) Transcript_83493:1463-1777(-)
MVHLWQLKPSEAENWDVFAQELLVGAHATREGSTLQGGSISHKLRKHQATKCTESSPEGCLTGLQCRRAISSTGSYRMAFALYAAVVQGCDAEAMIILMVAVTL